MELLKLLRFSFVVQYISCLLKNTCTSKWINVVNINSVRGSLFASFATSVRVVFHAFSWKFSSRWHSACKFLAF